MKHIVILSLVLCGCNVWGVDLPEGKNASGKYYFKIGSKYFGTFETQPDQIEPSRPEHTAFIGHIWMNRKGDGFLSAHVGVVTIDADHAGTVVATMQPYGLSPLPVSATISDDGSMQGSVTDTLGDTADFYAKRCPADDETCRQIALDWLGP